MRVNDIVRLNKKFLGEKLNNYVIHRDLMYKIEADFFLKSYYFEPIGNGKADLAVWWFIQPLFLRRENIILTFGDKLTYKKRISLFKSINVAWWDVRPEKLEESFLSILKCIQSEGEKELNSINRAEDFYRKYRPAIKDNIRIYEGVAFATILMEDRLLQDKMLQGLIDFSLIKINRNADWIDKIRKDAIELLNTNTQEQRLAVLQSWVVETATHLKIPIGSGK